MSQIERFKRTTGLPSDIYLAIVSREVPVYPIKFEHPLLPTPHTPVYCSHCGIDIQSEHARDTHEVNFCEALS